MKIQFWGTRGSLATPGPDTVRYGGNTSCVEISGAGGTTIILDAGTGMLPLGAAFSKDVRRVDILLTHLHLDHIQGLGFFGPLYDPSVTVHIWGPASTTQDLRSRLVRYLSPPLFPVQFRDLPCQLELHEVPCKDFEIGEFRISSCLICHPGPTVGFRISDGNKVVCYMPDHEPTLGFTDWPVSSDWISGYRLALGCDLLIHDAQYTSEQYSSRVGWGHSDIASALRFSSRAQAKQLYTFHHDPSHSDTVLEQLTEKAIQESGLSTSVHISREREIVLVS